MFSVRAAPRRLKFPALAGCHGLSKVVYSDRESPWERKHRCWLALRKQAAVGEMLEV